MAVLSVSAVIEHVNDANVPSLYLKLIISVSSTLVLVIIAVAFISLGISLVIKFENNILC